MEMKLPLFAGIIALVVVAGVGMVASDFTAYLGNDPSTCNNCHVMDGAYEGWYHSTHRQWAGCVDCHTPHPLIPKYLVKAESGYHHVTAFTFGPIPDAIRAKETSRQIVQENCERCHAETIANTNEGLMDSDRYCFECHRSVAHGERGISLLPFQHQENRE
jgi:cytochrome c nitrite reductase small subunit